jgi:hypothetical protein
MNDWMAETLMALCGHGGFCFLGYRDFFDLIFLKDKITAVPTLIK